MLELLVADKDVKARKQIAELLIEEGYDVIVTDSAAKAIHNVLKKTVQVLLLGTELDEFTSGELVPLLKRCNRKLMIILIADNAPLPLIRKIRKEGIFFHALRPEEPKEKEELRQVVKCAIESLSRMPDKRKVHVN